MRVHFALLAGALLATPLAAAASYQPPELKDAAVQRATLEIAQTYGGAVPGLDATTLRWFLYAIEHRESGFHPTWCNLDDGAGSWNAAVDSFSLTSDHLPHGCGLTQLTGWDHEGMPNVGNGESSPARLDKGIYGMVAPPRPVTTLRDPLDPEQNLARFVTVEVLPDFVAIRHAHPSFTVEETLRAVAFHWYRGEFVAYDPSECTYLCLYDAYVGVYRPAVVADEASAFGAPMRGSWLSP